MLEGIESIDPSEVFDIHDLLGEGAYGAVYKATDTRNGNLVAVKIIDLPWSDRRGSVMEHTPTNFNLDGLQPSETDKALSALVKEIRILRNCHSKYIVGYLGSYVKDNQLWIVMEFCEGGSFYEIVSICHHAMTEQEIAAAMKMMLLGLQYMHSANVQIIHRDIKSGNILLTRDGYCKFADFGISVQLFQTIANAKTMIGTPFWMAPEVMMESMYSFSADIWSLGITAIELATGHPPYHDLHPMRAMFVIPKNKPPTLPKPEEWSREFNEFISRCLIKDPKKRPSASQLLKHPFVSKISEPNKLLLDLVSKQLTKVEQHRITLSSKQMGKFDADKIEDDNITLDFTMNGLDDIFGTSIDMSDLLGSESDENFDLSGILGSDDEEEEISATVVEQSFEKSVLPLQRTSQPSQEEELLFEAIDTYAFYKTNSDPDLENMESLDELYEVANRLRDARLQERQFLDNYYDERSHKVLKKIIAIHGCQKIEGGCHFCGYAVDSSNNYGLNLPQFTTDSSTQKICERCYRRILKDRSSLDDYYRNRQIKCLHYESEQNKISNDQSDQQLSPKSQMFSAEALFNYSSIGSTDVSCKQGDILTVLAVNETNGWSLVQKNSNDKSGWLPTNYLRKIKNRERGSPIQINNQRASIESKSQLLKKPIIRRKPVRLALTLGCRNIPLMDEFSDRVDPIIMVYARKRNLNRDERNSATRISSLMPDQDDFKFFAQTEVVQNNTNPRFKKKIVVVLDFSVDMELQLRLFDVDGQSKRSVSYDKIGEAEINLNQLVSAAESKNILHKSYLLSNKNNREVHELLEQKSTCCVLEIKMLNLLTTMSKMDYPIINKDLLAKSREIKLSFECKVQADLKNMEVFVVVFLKGLNSRKFRPIGNTEIIKLQSNGRTEFKQHVILPSSVNPGGKSKSLSMHRLHITPTREIQMALYMAKTDGELVPTIKKMNGFNRDYMLGHKLFSVDRLMTSNRPFRHVLRLQNINRKIIKQKELKLIVVARRL